MDPITEPHPSSSNSSYAFITHSQETLPRNLPPTIDNATLARRRRRRTSAHDQAILEEEYRLCDRPDKSKRREIHARVQMGEKEVQIWFQNKRQSARRKAKPLLPHEIIPHSSQSSSFSFDPTPSHSQSSHTHTHPPHSHTQTVSASTSFSSDCPTVSFSSDAPDSDDDYDLPDPVAAPVMTTSAHQRLQDVLSTPTPAPTPAPPPPQRVNPRRTNPQHHAPPPRLLKRSSSIRLSTTLEGKATVVLEETPSSPPPPPPLPVPVTPRPPPQLQRAATTAPKRRIVDSRIWEFYCDNQAMIRQPDRRHYSSPVVKSKRRGMPVAVKPREPMPVVAKQKESKGKRRREVGVESDKENRPPGAPVSPPMEPRRKRRRVLGLVERERGGKKTQTQEVKEGSSIASANAKVGGDEMECVENLLSLRGGTWK